VELHEARAYAAFVRREDDGSAQELDAAQPVMGREGGSETAVHVRTFLIADVRGYTSYTQEHGDEEAGVLAARFAGLAREAVTAHGGELIELRGDEALSVFASARQAVRAAVELQRRFRARDTEGKSTFPLAVGIGLDAGEAVPIEGGYRGGALNLASRLCALAAPGQILASETVASLAGRTDSVRFVARRPVRLKGIEKSVRAMEVVPEPALPPLPETPVSKRPRVTRGRVVALALAGIGLVAAMVVLAVIRLRATDFLDRLDANAVGMIDADAAGIERQVPLQNRPSAVAAGGGFIWVASEEDGTLSRIDPETLADPETRAVQTVRVGASAAGVAYGGRSVWVTNSEERAVVQIDPHTLTPVQTFPVGNGPGAIAVGGQAVWVANTIDATVSRIDLARGGDPKTIPLGTGPVGLAVGAGAVWVSSEASGTLFRLDPRTGTIVEPIQVGNGPSGVAVGEDGVWVANRQDGTAFRVDPKTNSVVATIDVGPTPVSVAAGGGAVWVANEGDGTISRIDVDRNQVDKTISLASSPNALVLSGDTVWSTTRPSLSSHRGGVLRVESEFSACRCIDPASSSGIVNFIHRSVTTLAYDGLVSHRRVGGIAGGALVGNLAVRVPTPTDQGRTYTFQLRRGIHYSNGASLRASDFRDSLERLLTINPAVASFYGIVGASDCSARPPERCDLSAGIEVNDGTGTITIHLAKPDPDFLHKLALSPASVVPAGTPLRAARDQPIPGTGPYRIADFDPDANMRLVRNPHFRVWSPDARPDGYPDEIRVHQFNSEDIGEYDASIAAVESGEADLIDVITLKGERVRDLLTRRVGRVHTDPTPLTFWMVLNNRVAPFNDLRVRRALNFAVDRGRVIALGGGPPFVAPSCQILPSGFPGYQPYCPYTLAPNPGGTWTGPDLPTANALIGESGTRGMRVEVVIYGDGGPVPVNIARYFVHLLEQLGYRSSLRLIPDYIDYLTYMSDSRHRAQIGLSGWQADFLAPSDFFRPLFSCASFLPATPENSNWTEFCDRGIDAEMSRAAAAQTTDTARANEFWADVDRALVDQAVVVPFANPRTRIFVSDRVGNYQSHPLWETLLDQLWVE
jgi:peptide/nickel transport system substrate-binding protein